MASSDQDGSDSVPNCSSCPEYESKTADIYCTDCLEHMCLHCFEIHRRFKDYRHHKFIKKDEMPVQNISPETIDSTCECKREEHVVLCYCGDHQKLLCEVCITTVHKKCNYFFLSECSKDIETSEDYYKLHKELDNAEKLFDTNKATSEKNRDMCHESFEEVFKNMQSLKKRLKDTLDTIYTLEEKAMSLRREHVERFENIIKLNTTAVTNVRLKRYDLSLLQKFCNRKKLFVALHRSKSFLTNLRQTMDNTNKANTQQSYVFIPNELLESALTSFLEACNVVRLDSANDSKTVGMSECQQYPEYVFPKCIEISNGSIILIDSLSNVLKRIDNEGTVDQIKLSSSPWDIDNVSDTMVVVTQPKEEKVIFINHADANLRINKEINVNCRCEGVAYADNKVYIASSKPPAIVIYDTSWSKQDMKIELDRNGHSLFKQPAYIDVHPEKQLLCLSDRGSNKVFVFNCWGSLLREFESDDMKMPLNVSFRNNKVVVIGYESGTINVISLDEGKRDYFDTRYITNLRTEQVFSDSTFVRNACWGLCVVKYLSLICKNTRH